MEGLGQGMWDWRVPTDVVFYSREYLAILGHADGELPGTADTWVSRVHPDDLAQAEADLDAHLRGTAPTYHNEHRLRCKDGHDKWVLERGKVIEWDAAGRPSRVIGSLTDIDRRKAAELALRDSEQLFREIFDHAPIGLALIGPDLRWLDVNHSLCTMLGYEESELLQLRVDELTHPDDLADERRLAAEALAGQRSHASCEKRYLHKLGGVVHAQIDTSLIRDAHGSPRYFVSQVLDVSERRRFEDALFAEKELAQVTLGSIGDAVLRSDTDGVISYCNETALKLLGRPLLGRPLADTVHLYSERDGSRLPVPLERLARGEELLPPFARLMSASGELCPVECLLSPLTGRRGETLGSVLVLHDLSHTRLLSEQLIYQASHDPLTDLPNRREFEAELAHRLETARGSKAGHCVLYVDLDQFKLVNDTCGHPAGDRLLQHLAIELRSVIPEHALLARLGGDEFALILADTDVDQAERVAERVVAAIRGFRFAGEERSFQIGCSVGISVVDRNSSSPHQVLSQADTACYVAKRLGRGRVQLYRASDEEVRQAHTDMDWASRIEEALSNDQVELHAQRIVTLQDSGAPSYEILIRLRGEDGRLALPAAFLAAAERFGLSARIDCWVVRNTLEMLQTHLRQHGHLPFEYTSINLTGSSISDTEFSRYLLRLLSHYAVPPQAICFEITESAAFSSINRAREFISALRARGYRILLDDFGSGFTSFDYLRRIEVDGIKIDMDYTRDLAGDSFNREIAEFICRIAGQLHLQVVAEGVESLQTQQILQALGAQRAQGHLFHRAEPLCSILAQDLPSAGGA